MRKVTVNEQLLRCLNFGESSSNIGAGKWGLLTNECIFIKRWKEIGITFFGTIPFDGHRIILTLHTYLDTQMLDGLRSIESKVASPLIGELSEMWEATIPKSGDQASSELPPHSLYRM
jgi:hypothetical protein